MSRFHPSVVLFAFVCLILVSLAACGGGSATPPPPPPPPTPTYSIAVVGLDPSTILAGQTATSVVTVTSAHGYAGSVTLSCASLTTLAPSCAFSPNPVAVSGPVPAQSTLTVVSAGDTPGGTYPISITATDAQNLSPSDGPQTVNLVTTAVIRHVVVIFQENRTPDNLFQDPVLISRGADIAGDGINSLGQTVPLSPIDLGNSGSAPQNYDVGHTHGDFMNFYDNGKMDRADRQVCYPPANCPANAAFKYVLPSDVQPYFDMAEQFTFADRMFQTNQGPSFPAHQFILSGTSAPTADSASFAAENPNVNPAGCAAPANATVATIDATGIEVPTAHIYPCFEHATLTDLLDAAGITWRYYAPSSGSIWNAPNAIQHICQPQTVNGTATCTGPGWTANVMIPESRVLTDIANGQLAQVSWIIPDGAASDHSDVSDGSGPSWVASIVNAVGNSPYWSDTAILITWDDWGGWYDHVAPPIVNDGVSWGSGYIYGFRIPLIVVSPYAKAAYISHTQHDFGSILKFIETTYTLPTLGYADAYADDLSDCFTLTQSPITFHKVKAPLSASHFLNKTGPATDPDDD